MKRTDEVEPQRKKVRLEDGSGVHDAPHIFPGPIDQTMLTDCTWENMCDSFGSRKDMVHQSAQKGQQPQFALSATKRALALLPVGSKKAFDGAPGVQCHWVPFLVDTGSTPDLLHQRDR